MASIIKPVALMISYAAVKIAHVTKTIAWRSIEDTEAGRHAFVFRHQNEVKRGGPQNQS
jgi:hypothetical protein